MTTALTEGRHAGEFIISEANGHRSRENGTLAHGEKVAAGELLGGTLAAMTSYNASSAGENVVGIALYPCDATDAAQPLAIIARDAEVNGKLLTMPEATGDYDEAVAALAEVNIRVR